MSKAVNSQKSHGFREQMRIGREIANQLTPVKSVAEVAKDLGISNTMVRREECRALYKLAMRMRQLRAQGEI